MSIATREAVRFLIDQDDPETFGKYCPVDPALAVPAEMAPMNSSSPVSMFILTEAGTGLGIEQAYEGIFYVKKQGAKKRCQVYNKK